MISIISPGFSFRSGHTSMTSLLYCYFPPVISLSPFSGFFLLRFHGAMRFSHFWNHVSELMTCALVPISNLLFYVRGKMLLRQSNYRPQQISQFRLIVYPTISLFRETSGGGNYRFTTFYPASMTSLHSLPL